MSFPDELRALLERWRAEEPAPYLERVVICPWCGARWTLRRASDERMFCHCGHHPAQASDACTCGSCVRGRLATLGIVVPEIAAAPAPKKKRKRSRKK